MHYAPEKSAIIWKIKQFGGGKEFLMRAELGLPSVKGDDEHGGGMTGGFGGSMGGAQGGKGKRPISVKFEIPYFTTSGIQVRYLKIIEPKVRTSNLLLFVYAFMLPMCNQKIIGLGCGSPTGPERGRSGPFRDRADLETRMVHVRSKDAMTGLVRSKDASDLIWLSPGGRYLEVV